MRRAFPSLLVTVLLFLPYLAAAALAPHLSKTAASAQLVAFGRVHDVRRLDDGQLLVARFAVEKTFKGKAEGEITLIQMRSSGTRPPQFEEGSQALVLLRAATRNSYLRTHLGNAEPWEANDPLAGVLTAPAAGDAAVLARIGAQLAAAESKPPDAAARRQFVVDLLRARSPVVLADAAASLGELEGLAESLSGEELRLIEAVVRREDLVPSARAAVIRAAGKAKLRGLVPTLQKLKPADTQVQSAVWDALADLGAPLDPAELKKKIADTDPNVRKIAVREMLERGGAEAIPRVGDIAFTDPDESVRIAATELLGATKNPAAVAPLERVYGTESWPVRQAATRALIEIGGAPGQQALQRLAFTGSVEAQRYAVVALLISGVKFDDPIMKKIREEHPESSVRDVATHGIEIKEH